MGIILQTIVLTLTVYHATASQCNSDFLTTASGAKIESTDTAYKHRYMAISRELRDSIPYGSIAIVSGCSIEEYNGEYYVEDCMAPRFNKCIDLLVNPGMKQTKEDVYVEFKIKK